MPTIRLGNVSVVQAYKPDEGVNVVLIKKDPYAGNRVTTFALNETEPVRHPDGTLGPEDRPSRALNFSMVKRIWPEHSDKNPAWVEGDDELLVALLADEFTCAVGRPKKWQEG